MSLPGSNNMSPIREDSSTTLVTTMVVVAAVFMITTAIMVSIKLSSFYGKFLWDFQ